MEAKFSPRVKDVITYSREEALRLGHDHVGTEHLILGVIREGEGLAIQMLKSLEIDLVKLRRMIEHVIKRGNSSSVNDGSNIPLVKQAERALKITYLEAKLFKSTKIGTEHLLLAILKDPDNVATKVLAQLGVDYEMVKEELDLRNEMPKSEFPSSPADEPEEENDESSFRGVSKRGSEAKTKTPVLDNFGRSCGG